MKIYWTYITRMMFIVLFLMNIGNTLMEPTALLASDPVGSVNQPTNQGLSHEERMKVIQRFYNVEFLLLLGKSPFISPFQLLEAIEDLSVEFDLDNLTKLAWVIETNKNVYQPGEPIGFRLSLKNISDEDVRIYYPTLGVGFLIGSMNIQKILRHEKQKISKTREGSRFAPFRSWDDPWKTFRLNRTFHLKPGEKAPTNQPIKTLNPYYDLSEIGEYELTFFTRNFLGSDEEQVGEYPKPCTVRFKIQGYNNWLDYYVCWEEFEGNSPKESQDQ